MSKGVMYGRTEDEWQELEQAGWDYLKERAAERRGDLAHDVVHGLRKLLSTQGRK
jgi:hypothetical protein